MTETHDILLTKPTLKGEKKRFHPFSLFPSVNYAGSELKEIKSHAFSPLMNAVCCFFAVNS